MTPTNQGYLVFIAALGMMAGLMASDVKSLESWDAMVTPGFIGTALGHFAAVTMAFVGGKLIPTR